MNIRTVFLVTGLAVLIPSSWVCGQTFAPPPPVAVHRPVAPVASPPRVVHRPVAPAVSPPVVVHRPVAPAVSPPVAVYQPVPVVPAAPVFVRPRVFVPGQPIRNVLRAIVP